jgi:thiamine-phosphate pyrophosphorylase
MANTIYNGNQKRLSMLLYAITSRILLADTETERAEKLLTLTASWAATAVDFIQIRESDLSDADLVRLASRIVQVVLNTGSPTRVLINSTPKTAVACAVQSRADGVHLPGGMNLQQLAATLTQIREDWQSLGGSNATPIISVSCHSTADVEAARAAGATLALFAPVFEKALPGVPALAGQGLESLTAACRAARQPGPHVEIPVLALGGVTLENAAQCVAAGAAGIAAIRLFVESDEKSDWQRLSSRIRRCSNEDSVPVDDPTAGRKAFIGESG